MPHIYQCRDFPGRYLTDVPRAELLDFLHHHIFVPYDANHVVGIEGYWNATQHDVTIYVHTREEKPFVRVFSPRVSAMVHGRLRQANTWEALEAIVLEQLDLDHQKYLFSVTNMVTKNALIIPNPWCVHTQLRLFDYETVDLQPSPKPPHRVYRIRTVPDHYMIDVPRSELLEFLHQYMPQTNTVLSIEGYWKTGGSMAVYVHFPDVEAMGVRLDAAHDDRWALLKKSIGELLVTKEPYTVWIAHEGIEMMVPSDVQQRLKEYNYILDDKRVSEMFVK